jgi:hypothetical protein
MSYKRGTYEKSKMKYNFIIKNEDDTIKEELQFHSIADICDHLNKNYYPTHKLNYNQLNRVFKKMYLFTDKARSPDTNLFRRIDITLIQ